jgi:hypothetical protein
MVTLEYDVLRRFPRFSLYNSPYVAHREGRAIDLYPDTNVAPSPVAGTVESTKTTGCPSRPHAVEHDHLVVIDTGERLARILHVDPTVEPGDSVAVGDPLGSMIRSGYFAPWVDNHVHLGFRAYGDDPVRARGSLPVDVDVPIAGTTWDGTGRVVESGETYAILDGPSHPMPGEAYVGITDDSGRFVLDGGLSHYENGGIIPVDAGSDGEPGRLLANGDSSTEPIAFLGTSLGSPTGRNLRWQAVRVLANGTAVTGISFFFGLETIYAKLVCPEVSFEEGTTVEVSLATK